MPTVQVDGVETCKKKLVEAGRKVRLARERANLSLVDVAGLARCAINTVRGVESGADVKVSTVLRLCSVLDVQLGDLFGGV